jgi:hypothetical protein
MDGGLVIERGRIAAHGDFAEIRAARSDAAVRDLRGGYVSPRFCRHACPLSARVICGPGRQLDWLEHHVLCPTAGDPWHYDRPRLRSHFAAATAELFEAAEHSRLRILSGLVLAGSQSEARSPPGAGGVLPREQCADSPVPPQRRPTLRCRAALCAFGFRSDS